MAIPYRYLIVGGGITADAAVAGIREKDADGRIAVVSEEPFPPYSRPALSKSLFKGGRLEDIWRSLDYRSAGVDLYLTTRIVSLDPAAHRVADGTGRTFSYQRCLLATGGIPRQLPHLTEPVIYYRSLSDYFFLVNQAHHARTVAVLGGGFIGAEMAAALILAGKNVHQIVPEPGLLHRLVPQDLSTYLTDYYRESGVQVHSNTTVTGIRRQGAGAYLMTSAGMEMPFDLVVAGVGLEPRTELARAARLHVRDGIVAGPTLETSAPDVFTAGDAATVFNATLGRWWRVEHEDNANRGGALAGRNMAGAHEVFDYLPLFYSDLFDLGFEAVGRVDSQLQTVADWRVPYHSGVVYYLNPVGAVDGVLLWNTWNRVEAARALIESRTRFADPADVRGKIPF